MSSPIYRARDGKILGVCQGIARSRDIPVDYVRIGLVLLTLFSGFWLGLTLYIAAALILKPEPLNSTSFISPASRQAKLRTLQGRLAAMTGRVQKLEDRVTSDAFTWEQRLRGSQSRQ